MNFRKSISLLLVVLFGSFSQGQVKDERLTVSVANAKTISGVDKLKTYDEAGVILFEGDPKIGTCAVIRVVSEAANIAIDVSDQDRNPTPYKQLDSTTYFIDVPGKHWIDVTAIDFEKNIFVREMVTATVGPRPPPEPGPEPPPIPPGPTPDVPTDEFDNIGQRVAGWTEGLPSNLNVGVIYKNYATLLRIDPRSIKEINDEKNSKLKEVTEYSQYSRMVENINADLAQRWPMVKYEIANYWDAIAVGLGVK